VFSWKVSSQQEVLQWELTQESSSFQSLSAPSLHNPNSNRLTLRKLKAKSQTKRTQTQ
jgi:hypothetical protein